MFIVNCDNSRIFEDLIGEEEESVHNYVRSCLKIKKSKIIEYQGLILYHKDSEFNSWLDINEVSSFWLVDLMSCELSMLHFKLFTLLFKLCDIDS